MPMCPTDEPACIIGRAATLRQKPLNKRANSPSHSIPTPGQPVLALNLQRQAPSGVTASGVTASGVTPSGVTDSGVTASGITPSGVTPSGVTPSGVTPSGVTPSGVTPGGVTPSGETPSGVTAKLPASHWHDSDGQGGVSSPHLLLSRLIVCWLAA